jgi:hypothetical protein
MGYRTPGVAAPAPVLRRDVVRLQFGSQVLADAEALLRDVDDRVPLRHEPDYVDRFLVRLDAALTESYPGLSAEAVGALHWYYEFSFRWAAEGRKAGEKCRYDSLCRPDRQREAACLPNRIASSPLNAGDDTTARSLMTSDAWSRYAENGDAVSPSTFGQVCSIDGFRVTSSAPRDPEEAKMNLPEFAHQYEVIGEAHLTPKTLWPFGPITPHQELDGIASDDPDYYRQNYPESLASFASLFTLVRQTDAERWLVEFLGDELI